MRTKYPLLPISMADQYKLTQEAYANDIKKLLDRRYGQGMLILDPLFSKHPLKPFKAVIATLMAYDIINLIPQQVGNSLTLFSKDRSRGCRTNMTKDNLVP